MTDLIRRLWWSRTAFRVATAVTLLWLVPIVLAVAASALYLLGSGVAAACYSVSHGPWSIDWRVVGVIAAIVAVAVPIIACVVRIDVERENPYR